MQLKQCRADQNYHCLKCLSLPHEFLAGHCFHPNSLRSPAPGLQGEEQRWLQATFVSHNPRQACLRCAGLQAAPPGALMSAESNRLQHIRVPPRQQLPLAPLPCQGLQQGVAANPSSSPGAFSAGALTPKAESSQAPCSSTHWREAEGPAPSKGCGRRVAGKRKGQNKVASLVFQGNFPPNTHLRQIKVLFPWHKTSPSLNSTYKQDTQYCEMISRLIKWRNHQGEIREALLVSLVPIFKPLGCSSITSKYSLN